MTAQVLEIAYADPLDACWTLRDRPMTLLLHGSGAHPLARWTYVALDPVKVILSDAANGVAALAEARAWLLPRTHALPDGAPPFAGGVAGLFGYEMGGAFGAGRASTHKTTTPDLALGCYDMVAAFDHQTQRAFVVAPTRACAEALADLLSRGGGRGRETGAGYVVATTTRTAFEAAVAETVKRIRNGDLYQANLSRRYNGVLAADDHPYALFQRLCRQSAAPFCAYMRLDDHAIVSNSPERFLSVTRRDASLVASTKPIKGTRPRGATADEDKRNAESLLASEKDRAENLMIVDLMRNDLSKTCIPGSVRAPQLFALESFANVHHLVSEVEGRLRPDMSAFDLFAGAFPPGSITGAPKHQAMKVIDAYEQAARGAYCGALAWFGFDGAMDSSVLIRTATCAFGESATRVTFNVGAGIVAESDPAEEALETIAKAASLKRAISGGLDGGALE